MVDQSEALVFSTIPTQPLFRQEKIEEIVKQLVKTCISLVTHVRDRMKEAVCEAAWPSG